jgi:tripartite-type tricarboxylate transporter receptor subunit TctC
MRLAKFRILGAFLGAAMLALSPGLAKAEWPERPITLVIMYAAGGGTDVVLRTLAAEMEKATGWKINVVNKPGAVGGIATKFVLDKPEDGYWWLGAANYNKFVRVMGHSDSKPWEDWQYFQAANSVASWSVRPDSPFKSFDDVIKAAKAKPGELTISTSGSGGIWHELAATAAQAAGISLKYVPYKGGKPATLAGLNGEVDIAGGGVHEHIEHVRAGQLRNLQQTSAKDIMLPDGTKLPSIGNYLPELKPTLPIGGIYNLALRRSVPMDIQAKVGAAFAKAVESPTFKDIAKSKFFEIDYRAGEAADKRAAYMEAVTAKTFEALKIPGSHPASELGLPDPKDFEKWWPPKGYKPVS